MATQTAAPLQSAYQSIDLGDPSQINPAEANTKDIEDYRNAQMQALQALQHRYDQPNWFKVAAGFAKPQLGGFFASLGSAAEALGENVEAQRAQQLPIAEQKLKIAQSNILLNQRIKQNEIYQQWKESGNPMDATTYSRIVSLDPNSQVAKAATQYYEGAKAGLDIKVGATTAMGKDPLLQAQEWTNFQLRPDTDPASAKAQEQRYTQALENSRPPQVSPDQWAAMSRYDKQNAASEYAKSQREAGMSVEENMRQQANTAPERLALLRSIRDLSLGVGLHDVKDDKGNTVTGQQQMAQVLNYFGSNNPIDAVLRAASDGKLGPLLADLDNYARQANMSPDVRDNFQKLAKLLAENQVTLRGAATNPTDAYAALQQTASPNIRNSQKALVSLVDLMGHGEANAMRKYKYMLEHKVPYRHLEVDEGYNQLRGDYAREHSKIATSDPTVTAPDWYDPYSRRSESAETSGAAAAAPAGATAAAPGGGGVMQRLIEEQRRRAAQQQNQSRP